MIKAIIFDLNGVFITSPKLSERFSADFGVPIDEFLAALKLNMDRVRQPGVIDIDLWGSYLKKWGINFNQREFYDYWLSGEKENTKIVGIARKLKKKGLKLFILSNNFKERAEYYSKTFPFLDELFEKVYYSWQTGFVKPDIRAIQNVLDENSLLADECMYFDDSERNIRLAESLGVESYLLDSTALELLGTMAS